jgi:hypothetical protein
MPRIRLRLSLSWLALGAVVSTTACSSQVGQDDVSANKSSLGWNDETRDERIDSGTYRVVWDDFRDGFSINEQGADWFYFSAGPFVGDDGIETTSHGTLEVVPKGTNSDTGNPAFTKTVPQEDESGGVPGGLDHVKWLTYMNHTASSGFPGFDAEPGKVLSCKSVVGGRTYGTENQPFGDAVDDPENDSRLAAFAMNAIDFESLMVFDFFMTNETIYALYERLPFARAALGNYAAFTYQVPVAPNEPGKLHHLKISYDRKAGEVRWYIGARKVFEVDQLGHRLDSREHMTLDHGGTERNVEPRQLNCGMGMFTLLDAYRPSNEALVRLSNTPDFYFNPEQGAPTSLDFVDEDSEESSRLFGQGAKLESRRYVVSSRPTIRSLLCQLFDHCPDSSN